MNKKISILIVIGCFLILVNLGSVGISALQPITSIEKEKNQTQIENFFNAESLIPHADANGPYSSGINEQILFSGFGTSASFYSIYKWDFGDGSIGYGKYPTHIYSEVGEYYVTLEVTTINNEEYLDDTLVYIDQENNHLVPNGGCFYHADVEKTITFDASQSISNNPELPIVEYNWYFSDGTKLSGKKVTHSFKEEKVYMVTLYVKDSKGNARRDILHADIGLDYSSKWDFFTNIDTTLLNMLEKLFEGYSETLLDYFDAKIYTNYNGFEKLVDINNLDQLPLQINVDDSGVDDIILNDMKFFKPAKGPSLFGEGMDWWQFETTLSDIEKTVNSDIQIDDDFTICLQVNFGSTLAKWLGLNTPIIRIGYNSPSGEEMPEKVSLVHIFKPYFLQRWSEILETVEVGSYTNEVTVDEQYIDDSIINNLVTSTVGISNIAETRSISTVSTVKDTTGQVSTISEMEADSKISFEDDIKIENNEIEGYQHIVNKNTNEVLEDEYAPEYGLRLDNSGGGRFSLVRMFLKSETNSDTGLFLSISLKPIGDESTYLVYKSKKDGGTLHRGVKFEIPGEAPAISVLRKDNGVIKTQLTTSLTFSQDKLRKIIWDDAGASIKLESEAAISLNDFYFYNQNPELTITLDEITFNFAGVIELSLSEGIELIGEAGFSITDLNFITADFDASITGILSVDISNKVNIGLYKEGTEVGLKIGFTEALILNSDCVYQINNNEVTLKGVFTFTAANSEIRFALDNGVFIIRLMQGPNVEINNFYINVGGLIASADYMNIGPDSEIEFSFTSTNFKIDLKRGPSIILTGFATELNDLIVTAENIEIGASGEFFAEWEKAIHRVKIGKSTNSILTIENIKATFTNFEVLFDGQLNLDTKGWIEFRPYNFEVGFSGMVDVDCTIIMDYLGDQQSIILQGILSLHEQGSVGFNWQDNIEISLSSGTDLTIDDLLLEVGDLSTSAKQIVISTDGVIELTKSVSQFKINVDGGTSLDISDLDFELGDLTAIVSSIEIGLNGEFIADWNTGNDITLTVGAEASTSIKDIDMTVTDIISFNTLGILDVTAGGSITFAPTSVEVSANGNLGLSEGFEFTLNQVNVGISGNINANGDFGVDWISNILTTSIDGNCNWDIDFDTINLGDWELLGNLNGDISISTEKFSDGGLIEFNVYGTGTQNNLKIIHDDLTIELGAFNFDPGTIEFEWHREGSDQPGTLDITNSGISRTIASCKISYGGSDPIEIQMGSISSTDGVVNIIWYQDEFPHYIEIDSSIYLDVDPLKFTWGSKVLSFNAIELEPGKFYLGWYDILSDSNIITIKNSITNFGPGVSYEDTNQDLKLSASLGGLNDEYNTITLKTYKDSNGDISGLYLDSGGQQLATWIQLEAIKGDTGRRIELDGLKVQDFYIKKLSNGNLDWNGKIWLVNGLVFSKMVDEDTWIDLEVNWDLAAEGQIEFYIDDGFEDDWVIDTKIKGTDIDISVTDVAEYVRFAWDLENPLTTSGYVQIDTNSDPISEIDLTIKNDNLGYYPLWGIHTLAYGLAAEDYQVYWDFFAPPEEWILYETGWLQPGSIQDLDIGFLGNWYIIYDGGSRI